MSGYQGYNQTEYTGGNYDGGFSRGVSNGEGSQSRTTTSGGARSNSITPVTVKQMLDSDQQGNPDGPYIINNVELNLVSFVAIVRDQTPSDTNTLYKVEDGTGNFEFRRWHNDSSRNNDEMDEEMSGGEHFPNMKGKYAFITGSLKQFNEKKNLQYPTVTEITDHNQVLYHYLNAIKVHSEAQGLSGKSVEDNSNPLFVSAPAHEEADIGTKILKLIKDNTPSMPDGVPVQYIQQQLGVDYSEIVDNCNTLEEEAKIYNGVEEGTYLAV
ncbi:Rfa2 protein [Saccharomycopsis crataegensis]|uniref:Rfa2 protein n=1 Tax=Saccharomycopsis crataegensis TaxID=43959 RepID=A0AAV5QPN3_9ASCO|nr:Rfa2 protein [Saccharomycopsis crataegensis]